MAWAVAAIKDISTAPATDNVVDNRKMLVRMEVLLIAYGEMTILVIMPPK